MVQGKQLYLKYHRDLYPDSGLFTTKERYYGHLRQDIELSSKPDFAG